MRICSYFIQHCRGGFYYTVFRTVGGKNVVTHVYALTVYKIAADIPIIAMTANAFADDQQAALDAGMNEHVAKPVNVNKLKEVLSRFL